MDRLSSVSSSLPLFSSSVDSAPPSHPIQQKHVSHPKQSTSSSSHGSFSSDYLGSSYFSSSFFSPRVIQNSSPANSLTSNESNNKQLINRGLQASPPIALSLSSSFTPPSSSSSSCYGSLDWDLKVSPLPLGKQKAGLYKTEQCTSWAANQCCIYANKCRFAHGEYEQKPRIRQPTYRTSPCTDAIPCLSAVRGCSYHERCNYIHPGQEVRKILGAWNEQLRIAFKLYEEKVRAEGIAESITLGPGSYIDAEYFRIIKQEFPAYEMPFGGFF
jgi:hypothetical protein